MYVTGAVLLPFFALMTMLIAVPTGREDLQLDRHDVARLGDLRDADDVGARLPGVVRRSVASTGVILASPPLDFHLSDSYFVVAHFHYVVFGTVVFAMFAGFYFWWPKWTGKMLNERLGKVALLDAVHRLPHDASSSSTGWAWTAWRAATPTTRRRTASPGRTSVSTIGADHPRRCR